MILDISEYLAEWQDKMDTLLKWKMSTQLLPYKDLKSQQNGSPVKKEDLKSQQHGHPVKEEPTEASVCTKLLEDRSSREAAIGPPGLTESSSPFHIVWLQVTPLPNNIISARWSTKTIQQWRSHPEKDSEYKTETPGGQHLINLSPQSPHDHEKAPQLIE